MQKQDEVNSEEIKTSDVSLTDEAELISEKFREFKMKQIEMVASEATNSEDLEEGLSRLPGPKQLRKAGKIDYLTAKQEERLEQFAINSPEAFKEIAGAVEEVQAAEEELSELESKFTFTKRVRSWKPRYHKYQDEYKDLKDEYLFFEKRELYYEFAQDVMRENTAEMSKEEADAIIEMQQILRSSQQLPDDGLNSVFELGYRDFKHLKPDLGFQQAISQSELLRTPQPENAFVVPDIPMEQIIKQELGTHEGTRRFERIDRVSLDVSKSNFDKLKVRGKNERVYDV